MEKRRKRIRGIAKSELTNLRERRNAERKTNMEKMRGIAKLEIYEAARRNMEEENLRIRGMEKNRD